MILLEVKSVLKQQIINVLKSLIGIKEGIQFSIFRGSVQIPKEITCSLIQKDYQDFTSTQLAVCTRRQKV